MFVLREIIRPSQPIGKKTMKRCAKNEDECRKIIDECKNLRLF